MPIVSSQQTLPVPSRNQNHGPLHDAPKIPSTIFGNRDSLLSSTSLNTANTESLHPVLSKRKFKLVMLDEAVIAGKTHGDPITCVYSMSYEKLVQITVARAGCMRSMMDLPPCANRAVAQAHKYLNRGGKECWELFEDMICYSRGGNLGIIFSKKGKQEMKEMSDDDDDSSDEEGEEDKQGRIARVATAYETRGISFQCIRNWIRRRFGLDRIQGYTLI